MCYTATCPSCGKTTWDGCGRHVDDVMRSVPVNQQCRCQRPAELPPRHNGGVWNRRRG